MQIQKSYNGFFLFQNNDHKWIRWVEGKFVTHINRWLKMTQHVAETDNKDNIQWQPGKEPNRKPW